MTISTKVGSRFEARPAVPVSAAKLSGDRPNVLIAVFAIAGGLGAGCALFGAAFYPPLAPVLVPLAVVVGAGALCGAIGAERERALRDARERAESANDAKSSFLAAVSHEFRTPLNGILGLTDLLLESNLTPEQMTYARGVRSSGEALLQLVDEMLDFSRIEAGRFDLQPDPTDITFLLQDIGELLAARAHAMRIDLAVDVGIDLPASVLVDAARLRQVLVNLVDNAIKFTEKGGVVLSAQRRPGGSGDTERIAFSVEDSGRGIEPGDVERIFGEFEQADNAPGRRHGGAGLGLAISRRIVRRMGSEIELRARPGGGSVFSFELDLPVIQRRQGAVSKRLAGRRVLIFAPPGSEPDVLAGGLAEAGATVDIAADISDAVLHVEQSGPDSRQVDIALIDFRVKPDPVVALDTLRRAVGRRLPAVILIEPGNRCSLTALRKAGFDAYLVRPVRRSSLVRIVADVFAAPGLFRADPEDHGRKALHLTRGGQPLEVLIVDDNEINALLVRSAVESLGHRVTEVRDGTSAIDAVTQGDKPFDAILMDLHMPGIDGIAAAGIIRDFEARACRPRTKILALTADVLAETRARAVEAGVDAVLEKPISPDALRRSLEDVVQPAERSAG